MAMDNVVAPDWDSRYRAGLGVGIAAEVLTANAHLLPATGCALDLACGLGGNAMFLAARGFQVNAWDSSRVAIERLDSAARAQSLRLIAQVRDVLEKPPSAASFDVIVVSHFLERRLAAPICHALKPGGLLFYQTFSRQAVTDKGPQNPAYRLAPNELLQLFGALLVRVYRDEGRLGDLSQGFRDLAYLVAQKPDATGC
jgi:tellurite methyltransferase